MNRGMSEFNDKIAEAIAQSFKTAMKGIGCDEKRIIKEVLSLNNDQRQIVKHKYQTMYGHTLEEDLKSELKGHLEDIVIALLKPRYQFEAECVHAAIKGIGTNNKVVIEFLCSKDAHEINILKNAYKTHIGNDLEDDIEGEGSGALTRVYRSLASGKRPTGTNVDQELALKEAKEFHQAAEGKFFTNEGELVRILVSRSFAQLTATFDAYKKLFGKDIEKCIEKETRGDLEDALLTIVACIRNVPAYFAQRLLDAMKGLGSDKKQITRILVARAEVDLVKIKQEYKNICKRSLYNDLEKELRGDFEEIVLNLVGKD